MTRSTHHRNVHYAALLLGLCFGVGCSSPPAGSGRGFKSPQEAADALILAAGTFDRTALASILGPEGMPLVMSEDAVQDSNTLVAFAAEARDKMTVLPDSADSKIAIVSVGVGDWPLPIPLVKAGGKWYFDSAAGREELVNRRIGRNELDAIEICQGYVEAQETYAAEFHEGLMLRQYARRIVSTPGTRDGLAWRNPDSTWGGPVGEVLARIIEEGYSKRSQPYHGYYFKILIGQGPDAPMGEMDFMVKDIMIGGFAMVAAPAEYGVTGIMSFIVSHDGIVYQQDLGPNTLDVCRAMTRFNPDPGWTEVDSWF